MEHQFKATHLAKDWIIERTSLIIEMKSLHDVDKLSQYGWIQYISHHMNYVVLSVERSYADLIQKILTKIPEVIQILPSYKYHFTLQEERKMEC